MAFQKRYKPGQYPAYDNYYEQFMKHSWIRNKGVRDGNIHTAMSFGTLNDVENVKLMLIGREDNPGYYYSGEDGKEEKMAKIPSLAHELEEINKKFQIYQKQKVMAGFRKPTEWPAELLDNRLYYEAALDNAKAELEYVDKRIKDWRDEVEDDSEVLQYGLQLSGKSHHPTHPEIDGQRCSRLPGGELYINDTRSKYDGMIVADYRELAVKWRKQRDESDKQKFEAAKQARLKEIREKGESNIKLPSQMKGMKKYKQNQLPDYPADIPNVKQSKEEKKPAKPAKTSMKRKPVKK